jgi:hypothetical protein
VQVSDLIEFRNIDLIVFFEWIWEVEKVAVELKTSFCNIKNFFIFEILSQRSEVEKKRE